MDGDLAAKVGALLSDPEAVSRIAAIAGSLGGGTQQTGAANGDSAPAAAASAPALPAFTEAKDPRLAMLTSLRPLIREEKRSKIDSLVRALTLVKLLGSLRK